FISLVRSLILDGDIDLLLSDLKHNPSYFSTDIMPHVIEAFRYLNEDINSIELANGMKGLLDALAYPPCKVGKDRIDASVAIDAILRAEGIPVWAHPLGGEGEKRLTKEEFQIQFQELLSNGIKGLECYYSRYSQDDISFLVEQANAHGLLISGGSDYHGTNKPNLHIGKMSEDNMDVKEENLTLYTHFVK
ncbi:MAG: hypothetical protein ACI4UH_02875, partial [Dorea sp.]